MEENLISPQSPINTPLGKSFNWKTILIVVIVALIGASAYGAYYFFSNQEFAQVTPTPMVINTPIVSSSVAPQEDPITSPVPFSIEWKKYESSELAIRFEYPTPPGNTGYNFKDLPSGSEPAGTIFEWVITRTDISHSYTFAGGASLDFKQGRDRWITDNYRYTKEEDKYYLVQGGDFKLEFKPTKNVTRSDSLVGLIFNPIDNFFKNLPSGVRPVFENSRAAILNFPNNYHPKLGSITFFFRDGASSGDIERVIKSVEFFK